LAGVAAKLDGNIEQMKDCSRPGLHAANSFVFSECATVRVFFNLRFAVVFLVNRGFFAFCDSHLFFTLVLFLSKAFQRHNFMALCIDYTHGYFAPTIF